MKLFAGVGMLLFIVVGVIVGARLLLLARRTGEKPEFLVGLSLFVFAAVAQPAIAMSQTIGESFGRAASLTAIAIGLAANVLTVAALYLFNREVFRRESRVAGPLVAVAISCVAISASVVLYGVFHREVGTVSTLTKIGVSTMASNTMILMTWIAAESLSYWRRMKRRLALGLADPVVVNRFALWGAGAAACVLSPAGLIVCVLADMNIATDPIPMLLTATAGVWISSCWFLSFLPPESYLRWLRARSPQQGAVSD